MVASALIYRVIPLLFVLPLVSGCTKQDAPTAAGSSPKQDHETETGAAPTNRIDVPPAVRRNLGITFAKVEKRHIASTLRAPGRFELKPTARREVHAAVGGRVELLVDQYQTVAIGTPLARIDSPQWRAQQQQLAQTTAKIQSLIKGLAALENRLTAVEHHRAKAEAEEVIWTAHVKKLSDLATTGGGGASELAEARAQLALTHTRVAEVEEETAELAQLRTEMQSEIESHRQASPLLFADATGQTSASGSIDLSLAPAAAMLGVTVEDLRRKVTVGDAQLPYWRTVEQVTITADRAGIVESLAVTQGAWSQDSQLILTLVDPTALRFRAVGLQSDLPLLRDGQSATVVAPRGSQWKSSPIQGRLRIAFEANALARKIDLLVEPTENESMPGWARAGVAAEIEIITRDGGQALAVPRQAVIQDGLSHIYFLRDSRNPDRVIRLEADMGMSDGRWVILESGIVEGDEVVLDGIYELMLASSNTKAKGGHFHADGTFHEEDH